MSQTISSSTEDILKTMAYGEAGKIGASNDLVDRICALSDYKVALTVFKTLSDLDRTGSSKNSKQGVDSIETLVGVLEGYEKAEGKGAVKNSINLLSAVAAQYALFANIPSGIVDEVQKEVFGPAKTAKEYNDYLDIVIVEYNKIDELAAIEHAAALVALVHGRFDKEISELFTS